MSEISIHIEGDFNPKPNETYIGLINIDRPPFHLVTISNLKQFSWEVGKTRIGEPVDSLIRHLNKDKTRCVFLSLSEDDSTYSLVENAYQNSFDSETCIGPINAFLNQIIKTQNVNPLTVFELMDFLKTNSLWNGTQGLNMASDEIKLEVYNRDSVNKHVQGLKNLELQRS